MRVIRRRNPDANANPCNSVHDKLADKFEQPTDEIYREPLWKLFQKSCPIVSVDGGELGSESSPRIVLVPTVSPIFVNELSSLTASKSIRQAAITWYRHGKLYDQCLPRRPVAVRCSSIRCRSTSTPSGSGTPYTCLTTITRRCVSSIVAVAGPVHGRTLHATKFAIATLATIQFVDNGCEPFLQTCNSA